METLDPDVTALLIVHLQRDIVSPDALLGATFTAEAHARNVVSHARAAMDEMRTAGGLIVALRLAFNDDYSDLTPSMPLLQMVKQTGCLKECTDGAALVPELAVRAEDAVVTHQWPGPFTNSELQHVLSSHGVRNVIVCGVATNASVESAVRQAADLGYTVFVLTDACSAADASTHEASLASMALFAQHMDVDDLRDAFMCQPR